MPDDPDAALLPPAICPPADDRLAPAAASGAIHKKLLRTPCKSRRGLPAKAAEGSLQKPLRAPSVFQGLDLRFYNSAIPLFSCKVPSASSILNRKPLSM